jgi:hypothetical protein
MLYACNVKNLENFLNATRILAKKNYENFSKINVTRVLVYIIEKKFMKNFSKINVTQ